MISDYFNIFLGKYHKRRGMRFINRSNFKKALYHFEKAFMYYEDLDNLYFYSVCLISLNRHAKAISFLERIFDKSSENILISVTLAECYLVIREWEKAEQIINMLTLEHKNNQLVQKLHFIVEDPIAREKYALGKEYFFKAMEDLENKKMENSFENIKKAIEMDEANASYYFTAGVILSKSEKPVKDVVYYFEKAVQLSPQNETFKKQLNYIKTLR